MAVIRLLALVALCWLAGCTTVPEAPTEPRQYQETIELGGRLSVRYEQGGRAQSLQGKFRCEQRGDLTDIRLFSPLGQTMAKIALLPGRATLEQSDRQPVQADDATLLTEQVLGWAMPVEGLRFWLQGFVQSPEGKLEAAQPEPITAYNADGWRVRYVSWQRNARIDFPRRIDLERVTAEAGPILIRLIIDEWKEP